MSKKNTNKKLIRLNTKTVVADETTLNKIPVAKNVNIEEITKNDKNVVEVVAKIPVSKSKRKWNYTENAIKNVVDKVNEGTINGFKGHQKAEDVNNKFPSIATHWIGGYYDDNEKAGYVRGIVDKSQEDLKGWINSNRINQVSIFGRPTLKRNKNGAVDVTNYDLMSIDWTPLGRAGMDTEVYKVASGEMEVLEDSTHEDINFFGELDGSFEEIQNALREALNSYFGTNENKYIYTVKTFKNYAIVKINEYNDGKESNKHYKVEYSENDDIINISKSEEVKEIVSYEPIKTDGEMEKGDNMTEKEEKRLNDLNEVFGEMSIEDIEKLKNKADEADKEKANKIHGEMVNNCLSKKIENEDLKNFILGFYNFTGKDEETVNGEIAKLMESDFIKEYINKNSIPPQGGKSDETKVDGIEYGTMSIEI